MRARSHLTRSLSFVSHTGSSPYLMGCLRRAAYTSFSSASFRPVNERIVWFVIRQPVSQSPRHDTTRRAPSLTRGTPTKMTLFSAASRIIAALSTASLKFRRVSTELGSLLVMNLYRWPTADGRLTVRRVHVCRGRHLPGGWPTATICSPTERARHSQHYVAWPRSEHE